jgi:small subunit ribosomal protein S21
MARNRFNDKEIALSGLYVEVRNNDVGKALRKFKKKVAEDGILQDLRKREYFESKGTKRRKSKEAAIRRYKKKRLKEQDNW